MMSCSLWVAAPVLASEPPSRFGIDAPELASLGTFPVGVKTLTLVSTGQVDVLAFDAANGTAPTRDRTLLVDLWYPARRVAGATTVTYAASFPSEPPAEPASFSVPGIGVRDAPAAGGGAAEQATGFPLVVVSHGYSNDPAAMTWLTENLASKGYVVAAIRHADPPITDPTKFVGPLLRRPLDIAFVVDSLRKSLAKDHLIDPSRIALVGYSMGGYGVITAAGASLDPTGPPTTMIPAGLLKPYVRGGARQDATRVKALRAVVAISPAGGGALAAWGAEGLAELRVPLLLIAGDRDRTVDYRSGAHAIFAEATHAERYLLTFQGAGHSIGLNPAPDAMRSTLWDQDWFEDPVWRKERVNAINAHFITAFLDLYLKGAGDRAAYLAVPVTDSAKGSWAADAGSAPYAAFSPGAGGVTVWKGFQRSQSAGLELLHATASP